MPIRADMNKEFNYQKYWNDRLSGQFGLEAVGYIGLGKRFNQWMYSLRKRSFIRSVKRLKLLFSDAKVLDVGSGTGFYLGLWKGLGVKSITGIDISEQAIENLKHKFPAETFYLQDITKIFAHDRKFDLISCMDVLFHIVDDENFKNAIQNLSHSLVSGGYLILTDNFVHGPERKQQHHVSRSLSNYEHVIMSVDLRIVYRKPVFFFLNYPVDSNNYALNLLWKFFLRVVPGNENIGYLMGCLFYPIDLILARVLSEGPSTEIMICKKL